ncbi:MAG: glucosamine-6-phosphate deaminase [bacterium]|nr:glucosamine-6-phosphate deaminase [bacterium]MDZ4296013.1 glucosamine-6-phosphate deaminase [Patescibacteria group bacterium]
MRVMIASDYEAMSRTAAQLVAEALRAKPGLVLGLATGSTPVGMYAELVRMHRKEALDFSAVRTFNLDEYIGLSPEHPQSYHAFMRQHLFDHVNARPENIHIPDGTVTSGYDAAGAAYEALIEHAGGIDFQVLGIGTNGHVGFNEPTSGLASRTRAVVLTDETRKANKRFFGPDEAVPELAMTMGMGTILDAKKIVLLASGAQKAPAVALSIEGPVSAMVPASALQLHRNVTVILDEAAAGELTQRPYYDRVTQVMSNV